MDLAGAWKETREAFPNVTMYRAKYFYGFDLPDGVDFHKAAATTGLPEGSRCIDFQIHPDLTVTCSPDWEPIVTDGKLYGFRPVTA
jgi:hypothetical protein